MLVRPALFKLTDVVSLQWIAVTLVLKIFWINIRVLNDLLMRFFNDLDDVGINVKITRFQGETRIHSEML